jgi:transposase
MKKVQKTSTVEFKREAVRWAQTSGKPIAPVARELGISDTSISNGARTWLHTGTKPFRAAAIKPLRRRNCAASKGNWR